MESALPGKLFSAQRAPGWTSRHFRHQLAIPLLEQMRLSKVRSLLSDPSPIDPIDPIDRGTVCKTKSALRTPGVEQVDWPHPVSLAMMSQSLPADGKHPQMKCVNVDDGLKALVQRTCPSDTTNGSCPIAWLSLSSALEAIHHLEVLLFM